ncbi:PE-PPE domain-containing protein [Mycobacterium attenuatum]|uniref:PE-PPE domain-containing protein n=1 Tax=Mycobacterium attenuatum TaxID=2341086 RepID=UPI000F01C446|nr:PE-PPE domain-containing protein [Mycobacterium attenuatum]VBA61616.1 SL1278 acyltransferase Chp1 [Mycobacterium attenuatum]
MSYVVATPELLVTAAGDLAEIGSAVSAANAQAASSTTSLLAAAADEVSTRIAALFGAYGLECQGVVAAAAQWHARFVLSLAADANAYLNAEFANAQQHLPNAVNAPAQLRGYQPLNTATSAAAGTRITIPGAGPLYYPNFITTLPYLGQVLLLGGVPGPSSVSILQGYELLNHAIGQNWFPGTTAQLVNYPASIGILSGSLAAPSTNDAVAMGQRALNDQIMNAFANGNGSPVRIAGLSEGTIVVNRELAYLAANPSAPPPDALQFAMFSSPELGLAHIYLPTGMTVPLINYTVQGLPNTQYDVSVVFGQYDFWGNPPDRPWNLPAAVNSLFGAAYYHNTASLASLSDAVQLSSTTTSSGGTITTYVVPAPTLPMLLPLTDIGVPKPIVDALNSLLQPIVNEGYSSLTPEAGPYFSHGSLVGLPTAADVVGSVQRDLVGSLFG